MTSRWVLLLTDDPLTVTVTSRLAGSVGLTVRSVADPPDRLDPGGAGPPGLVLLGSDRLGESLPAVTSGAPKILIATGEPEDRFWRAALEQRVEQVVLLPEAEQVLLDRLTRVADQPDHRALTIAVIGGCGGAGASVLAAALARAAVRVSRSLLIEVDPLSGGVDLLLGAEDEPGLRWPDLATARGRLAGSVLGAVPVIDGLHVLSWDRAAAVVDVPAAATAAVLESARQEFGIVVLDLPRRLDETALVAVRSADLVLIVVPAEVRAAAAARRVATGLQDRLADVRLVVRGPSPTGLSAETIADALDLPLAGVLRPEPGLGAALDRGEPPGLRARGALSTLCRELLAGELIELTERRQERRSGR